MHGGPLPKKQSRGMACEDEDHVHMSNVNNLGGAQRNRGEDVQNYRVQLVAATMEWSFTH